MSRKVGSTVGKSLVTGAVKLDKMTSKMEKMTVKTVKMSSKGADTMKSWVFNPSGEERKASGELQDRAEPGEHGNAPSNEGGCPSEDASVSKASSSKARSFGFSKLTKSVMKGAATLQKAVTVIEAGRPADVTGPGDGEVIEQVDGQVPSSTLDFVGEGAVPVATVETQPPLCTMDLLGEGLALAPMGSGTLALEPVDLLDGPTVGVPADSGGAMEVVDLLG